MRCSHKHPCDGSKNIMLRKKRVIHIKTHRVLRSHLYKFSKIQLLSLMHIYIYVCGKNVKQGKLMINKIWDSNYFWEKLGNNYKTVLKKHYYKVLALFCLLNLGVDIRVLYYRLSNSTYMLEYLTCDIVR